MTTTDPNGALSVADAYLGLLAERGVEYLFGNAGTDFGPLIDAHARRTQAGAPTPAPIMVTHEITAMAMAHGYQLVSGRTPVVMVHTVAGTANAIGGLINANRAQVPMLFTAGRTPLTEGDALGARDIHIHWAQESFDQGSMVREWVKWDYELRAGADLAAIVDRAMAIAESSPRGPVYLTLPREVVAGEAAIDDDDLRPPTMRPGATVAAPDAIRAAADALLAARNPIIITRSVGRDPDAVDQLQRLAETLVAPVFDPLPTHLNLDFDHEYRVAAPADRHVAGADAIVVVECDVPWTPKAVRPAPSTPVIAIGADPLHSRYPVRNFPVDLNLGGAPSLTLAALSDAIAARIDVPSDRRERVAALVADQRTDAANRAAASAGRAPLDKAWFTEVLDDLLPPDVVIVDELGCDTSQLSIGRPAQFFGVSQAGVLGWGLGASLGAKLAAPDRPVVGIVGDGSYLFGVPTTAHWVARRFDLPVLYLVWNNAKWRAVEGATRMVYPDGWAVRTDHFSFSGLQPAIDYEMVCQSAGGHGERVDDPADLGGALERGLKAVSEGRQALVNLIAHET